MKNSKSDTRRAARAGLTLVEVMISVVIMAGVLLAVVGSVLQSYRMNEDARRRDQVRAVLQTYVDYFLSAEINPKSGFNPFFGITTLPTGDALSWTNVAGSTVTGTSSGLKFKLGGANAPEVVLMRWVRGTDETDTTGTPDFSMTDKSSTGREYVGQFTATYTSNRRTQVVVLTAVRADS